MSMVAPGGIAAAKELLERLKAQTNQEQRRRSLDLLWQALEEMRRAGVTEFKIVEVGRKAQSLGGPKAQSIRNATGLAFRQVIGLYSAAFEKPAASRATDDIKRALATVSNISARKIFEDEHKSKKAAEAERDRLRLALASVNAAPPKTAPLPSLPSSEAIQDWAVDAFQLNFSGQRLAERGLSIELDGSVRNVHGATLFTPDLFAAINHVMKAKGRPELGNNG